MTRAMLLVRAALAVAVVLCWVVAAPPTVTAASGSATSSAGTSTGPGPDAGHTRPADHRPGVSNDPNPETNASEARFEALSGAFGDADDVFGVLADLREKSGDSARQIRLQLKLEKVLDGKGGALHDPAVLDDAIRFEDKWRGRFDNFSRGFMMLELATKYFTILDRRARGLRNSRCAAESRLVELKFKLDMAVFAAEEVGDFTAAAGAMWGMDRIYASRDGRHAQKRTAASASRSAAQRTALPSRHYQRAVYSRAQQRLGRFASTRRLPATLRMKARIRPSLARSAGRGAAGMIAGAVVGQLISDGIEAELNKYYLDKYVGGDPKNAKKGKGRTNHNGPRVPVLEPPEREHFPGVYIGGLPPLDLQNKSENAARPTICATATSPGPRP